MSVTGLRNFDETVHATNIWLKDVMEELGWEERGRAYHALRVTLHALRDRLPVESSAHFASQLPMLMRGFYFEGWRPAAVPSRDRTAADFTAHVAEGFSREEESFDAEKVVRAVFAVVSKHVSAGEVEDVRRALPEEVRALWAA